MDVQALIYLRISLAHIDGAIKGFAAGDRHAAWRDLLLAGFYACSAGLVSL